MATTSAPPGGSHTRASHGSFILHPWSAKTLPKCWNILQGKLKAELYLNIREKHETCGGEGCVRLDRGNGVTGACVSRSIKLSTLTACSFLILIVIKALGRKCFTIVRGIHRHVQYYVPNSQSEPYMDLLVWSAAPDHMPLSTAGPGGVLDMGCCPGFLCGLHSCLPLRVRKASLGGS